MIQIQTFLIYAVLSSFLVFIPTEESGDYCLFKFDDKIIELYIIGVENEYSIIVVYTIL